MIACLCFVDELYYQVQHEMKKYFIVCAAAGQHLNLRPLPPQKFQNIEPWAITV